MLNMDAIQRRLTQEGYQELPDLFDPAQAKHLLAAIVATRPFDEALFLTEEQWDASPKTHKHTNPGPGFNVLEQFPEKLDFVEKNPELLSMLRQLLGPNFRWLSRKMVCRVPSSSFPRWLKQKLDGRPANTLGAFIQPKYRDMSYFYDVDIHQDIQDWIRMPAATREHRYITLYVYLDDVTPADAPIYLLPGTHRFGTTPYQHDVTYDASQNEWVYRDGDKQIKAPLVKLTGRAGFAGMWHPSLLHGTRTMEDGRLRISLRYLIGRDPDRSEPCLLDAVNDAIEGPLYLETDFTPGANAREDGSWNLEPTDFIKYAK